ncbi:hypothetical protein Vadar_027758 [Vaccinium darrowii]|uniref:Uncharacterized protein n=1 Tax=Vaccinium darrowii TaxID=229202 RepID=A0ACB7Z7B8_9ERIC|nr:hypothetical protein Vadar_027758 [Vaccinium darrowii]
MVPKLEAIRGGGGSVKVGTTGTIGALITRELESTKSANQTTIATLAPLGATSSTTATTKRLMPRTSPDEASSSSTINKKSPETIRKTKHYRKTHQVPMLGSDSMPLDRTPRREKPNKRGSYIVEVVDIKCGNRTASRLKKLSFSKLSESVA